MDNETRNQKYHEESLLCMIIGSAAAMGWFGFCGGITIAMGFFLFCGCIDRLYDGIKELSSILRDK